MNPNQVGTSRSKAGRLVRGGLLCLLSAFAVISTSKVWGAATTRGPGDVREGYESSDYATRSVSLLRRTGEPVDLLQVLRSPPLGLPPVPVPGDNPVTAEKVSLGRKLFYDRRLSLNDTMSCAMCHVPEQGFTSNELATAVGIEGRTVRRNAPTLYNVAYFSHIFHDGRETRLEYQIWHPLLAKNEMASPGIGWLIEKIRSLPDYEGLFEAAFQGQGPGLEAIGKAIASYERTLVSGNSFFDRWRYGGEENALSGAAQRGFALFVGRARCASCHLVGERQALFTDDAFHDTGIGWDVSVGAGPAEYAVQLAPGVTVKVPRKVVESVGDPLPGDLGRYEVTQDPIDRWRYKTPSLRNVALTAPYMHNGSFGTLREVIIVYNQGGIAHPGLDPLIGRLGLEDKEIDDLVAFLQALTGDNVDFLVQDAFAAPIGDRR